MKLINSVFVLVVVFASLSALAQETSGEVSAPETAVTSQDASEREPASSSPQRPQQRHLSPEEQRILDRGPVPQGRYISGGVTGSIVGFGIGHAIQGRYGERGWIFTVGELGSITAMIVGAVQCATTRDAYGNERRCTDGDSLIVTGLVGIIGFHVWEVIDLWVTPNRINRRYDQLTRSSNRMSNFRMTPTLDANATPGLALAFDF
jgi:hypothetical protein